MASQYIAFVHSNAGYRRSIVARAQRSTGLSLVFEGRRIDVLSSAASDIVALGHYGALIGHVFRRHGRDRVLARFAPDEVDAIIGSGGAALITQYWGGYVAVAELAAHTLVLRDPSAAMPCYRLQADGLSVFASDADILRRARLLSPGIEWNGLARHLYTDGLPSSQTAIAGVEELLPGTAARVDADHQDVRLVWSPWDHVTPTRLTSGEAAERLRSVVRQSVVSWASLHTDVLVGVSGGLDSSIVAACLAGEGRHMLCMTMVTEDADGDERAFAELLSREIDVELIASFYDLGDIRLDRSAAPHLPLPVSRSQAQSYNAAVARLARVREIGAFFTGNGGDNVFAFSQSAAALYDRWRHEGWRPGLISTLMDTCKLTGCSPLQAVQSALKLARAAASYRWRAEPLFLHADVIATQAQQSMSHAWLDAPAGALPGKAAHIAGLLRVQRNLHTSERAMGLPVVNPLMAQPVIEACLQIPSWVWREGGVNRAVARVAFAGALPDAIAYRTTKGRPDSFCNDIIEARRTDIADRLLDGQMARNGLLDRAALNRALFDPAPDMGVEQVRLLALVETEAWLEYWRSA